MSATKFTPFASYLTPTALLFCNDALTADDGSVSLIRLIDQLVAPKFPFTVANLFVVTEFRRNVETPIQQYRSANLKYGLRLKNPADEVIDIGNFIPGELTDLQPWFVNRLILNLSQSLTFKNPGCYTWLLTGSASETEQETLLAVEMMVTQSSPVDGLYIARWKSAEHGDEYGEGVVQLINGRLMGADAIFQWKGTFSVVDTEIQATALVTRFAPGPAFINADSFEIQLRGVIRADKLIELKGETSASEFPLMLTLRRLDLPGLSLD